jgi:hypothetical protein
MGLKNWIFGSEEKIAAKKYNNQLMSLINDNEQDISAMNSAMSGQDFDTAQGVCETWERNIDERIRKVHATESFHGDDSLKNAILKGLQIYRKIVSEDYPMLIELRKDRKTLTVGPTLEEVRSEQRLLANINQAFEAAAMLVNNARFAFKQKVKNL